ncbi:MAG: PorV/PorQ family protein [candidate division KSB1 bacterium]|nr:PorV/PorQ family protein [candidate division KSB1 bacterium]
MRVLKRVLALAVGLSLWAAGTTRAQQVKKVGTTAAAFLRIPVGAKAVAMGSAFSSLADDGSALFWNPGAAALLSRRTLFVHHSPWLPGLDYTYVAFALPVARIGVGGISVTSLRTEEMEVTTPEAQMGTGETFTAASTAIGFTFASSLTDRFSIGGSVKYVTERIFHSSAGGVAFDVGTLFVTPFRGVRFGMSVSNVGTKMQIRGEDLNSYVDIAPSQEGNNDEIVAELKTDRFDLPIVLRLGVSWDWRLAPGTVLTLAVDGVNPNDNAHYVNVGAQVAALDNVVFLWGGFNELFLPDREKGPTFGAGLRLPSPSRTRLCLAYAYQDFRYLGPVSHFSIEIAF